MDIKEQKKEELYKELSSIIDQLESMAVGSERLDQVELKIFKRLLKLGFNLLSYYILIVGFIVLQKGVPVDSTGKKMRNTGKQSRPYRSIFGVVQIERPKYYSSVDKVYYALDKELGLPMGKMSYLLSDWLSYGAVDLDFRESAGILNRILGQDLYSEQSSRSTYHVAEEVEAYYEEKTWDEVEDKSHLSVGFDGKGVRIMKSETSRADESVSVRLGRGQKKQIKKEATVSVGSSFSPKTRSCEDIIKSLFTVKVPDKDAEPPQETNNTKAHRWHENKHTRAFVSDKAKAINYGIDNILSRDKTNCKPIIILIDGDRSLRKAVEKAAKDKSITHRISAYVLDFIHVIEYIWKVGNAYKGEKSEQREQWVKQQATLLLEGKVQQVIDQWENIKNGGKNEQGKSFSVNQLYNINRGITYFKNHQDMMSYDQYLEKGYPITTGAIESACGHFVKSRMEKNAMHWSMKGAQNMLNIRAIKKNDDWEDYNEKFILKEQAKLYKLAA